MKRHNVRKMPFARPRRGISALALILAFALIVALLGLAIDIGLLVQRQQQLKTASESAALAAALEQFGCRRADGAAGREDVHPSGHNARRVAAAYAAANPIGTKRVALDLNASNHPRGDIVFGNFEPPALGGVFRSQGSGFGVQEVGMGDGQGRTDDDINAVLVRTRHSQVGNTPLLLLSQMVGVPSHDIFTESIAAVDRRVLGFRPVGCSRVPMLPLIVKSKGWRGSGFRGQGSEEDEGDDDEDEDEGHGRDKFSCDPRSGHVAQGPDGVPELELVIKCEEEEDSHHGQGQGNNQGENGQDNNGQGNDGQGNNDEDEDEEDDRGRPSKEQKARLLCLAGEGDEPGGHLLAQQVVSGLSTVNLQPWGGELVLGNEIGCLPCGKEGGELSALNEALQHIIGQPRVVALGNWRGKSGQSAATVENFAACVVVDSQAASKSLTIRVQPVQIHSCTTITGSGVRSNPWIGKIVLVR